MKKVIHCLLALLTLVILSGQSYALTLSLEPSSQLIYPNDPLSVDLNISGLGDGGPDSLGAFSLDFVFNSDILTYDSVVFGPYLGNTDPLAYESFIYVDDSNAVNGPQSFVYLEQTSFLYDFELDSLQGDSFTLATLNFTGASPGFTLLRMDNVVLSDAFGFQLPDPTLVGSGVQVTEPSTMVLFMMAGLVMVGLIKRQNL